MKWLLLLVGGLHLFFMLAELFPWSVPLALRLSIRKLPVDKQFGRDQVKLVSGIVHNAGIYNGIVAGGIIYAVLQFGQPGTLAVAHVMLIGATVAGLFGLVTLKSPLTAVQAGLGIAALVASR